MSESIRVAGAQMDPRLGDVAHNLSRCVELMRTAVEGGAQLVVFPEAALSGYVFRSLEEAAGLAVLASYASGAGAADVLVALVADVRRVKGAAAGRVSVSTVLATVRAVPDSGLENLRETP